MAVVDGSQIETCVDTDEIFRRRDFLEKHVSMDGLNEQEREDLSFELKMIAGGFSIRQVELLRENREDTRVRRSSSSES